ncbi:uncharacterized protein LOC134557823, partial [Prinia subflava]|uniref:uncharacterized protein LOC134557823 n=1 Tax=Prinia subflava TaxID=208062 RepID=UPI002FDF0B76
MECKGSQRTLPCPRQIQCFIGGVLAQKGSFHWQGCVVACHNLTVGATLISDQWLLATGRNIYLNIHGEKTTLEVTRTLQLFPGSQEQPALSIEHIVVAPWLPAGCGPGPAEVDAAGAAWRGDAHLPVPEGLCAPRAGPAELRRALAGGSGAAGAPKDSRPCTVWGVRGAAPHGALSTRLRKLRTPEVRRKSAPTVSVACLATLGTLWWPLSHRLLPSCLWCTWLEGLFPPSTVGRLWRRSGSRVTVVEGTGGTARRCGH